MTRVVTVGSDDSTAIRSRPVAPNSTMDHVPAPRPPSPEGNAVPEAAPGAPAAEGAGRMTSRRPRTARGSARRDRVRPCGPRDGRRAARGRSPPRAGRPRREVVPAGHRDEGDVGRGVRVARPRRSRRPRGLEPRRRAPAAPREPLGAWEDGRPRRPVGAGRRRRPGRARDRCVLEPWTPAIDPPSKGSAPVRSDDSGRTVRAGRAGPIGPGDP